MSVSQVMSRVHASGSIGILVIPATLLIEMVKLTVVHSSQGQNHQMMSQKHNCTCYFEHS